MSSDKTKIKREKKDGGVFLDVCLMNHLAPERRYIKRFIYTRGKPSFKSETIKANSSVYHDLISISVGVRIRRFIQQKHTIRCL